MPLPVPRCNQGGVDWCAGSIVSMGLRRKGCNGRRGERAYPKCDGQVLKQAVACGEPFLAPSEREHNYFYDIITVVFTLVPDRGDDETCTVCVVPARALYVSSRV